MPFAKKATLKRKQCRIATVEIADKTPKGQESGFDLVLNMATKGGQMKPTEVLRNQMADMNTGLNQEGQNMMV